MSTSAATRTTRPPAENTDTYLDNLIAPHSDDFNLGAERELVQDLVASLYFQAKFTQNLFEDDELNLIWDQDGYQYVGTSDGTDDVTYRLRTPNIARRNYYQGSYAYTRSHGTTLGQVSSFLDVAPQDQFYLNGVISTDVTHDVALGAYWDLPTDPWTTTLGSTFTYESGNPLTRGYNGGSQVGYSMLYDTIGTYAREESTWSLSARAEQAIPVRRGKLSNNRQGQSAYVSGDNRWIISSRQSPMRASVGVEYEF